MALTKPLIGLTKRANSSLITRPATQQTAPWQASRCMATIVPPVTQDSTSSKGPTAMVFMNMGGPATTDEVGDFLSRLFVRPASLSTHMELPTDIA